MIRITTDKAIARRIDEEMFKRNEERYLHERFREIEDRIWKLEMKLREPQDVPVCDMESAGVKCR